MSATNVLAKVFLSQEGPPRTDQIRVVELVVRKGIKMLMIGDEKVNKTITPVKEVEEQGE